MVIILLDKFFPYVDLPILKLQRNDWFKFEQDKLIPVTINFLFIRLKYDSRLFKRNDL